MNNCITPCVGASGGGGPNFIDTISNVLRALPFSQNQYSRILKNKIKVTRCLDEIRKSD